MMQMSQTLMRQLSLLLACVAIVRQEPIVIDNHWQGGFQGHVTIHPTSDIIGWKLILQFDQPVDELQIWNVEVEAHNSTVWIVHNLDYDEAIDAGSSLEIGFVGKVSGDAPSHATYRLEPLTNSGVDGKPDLGTGGTDMKYDYKKALGLSILFYDAQRSGQLPANNPISWRGDSALQDGSDHNIDLTGGWYDAGDHVKFGLPMAWSSWVLNWGFLKFTDAYEAAGQKDMMCDMARWPLEYFLKAWRPASQELYVQVGDGTEDHHFWGSPENMKMPRPSYKVDATCPGSDVSAKTVSAFISGYFVYNNICGDAAFANELLAAGKSLYIFAKTYRGKYTDCVREAAQFYSSGGDKDELATAAAWLYKATGNDTYLTDAKSFYPAGTAWGFNWNDDNLGASILLYEETHARVYRTDINKFLQSYNGGYVPTTPCGLSFRDQWGPNRHAANAAFIALLAASDGLDADTNKLYALSQIDYILGDNKNNISYQVGFGTNYPTHPHHRGSSCLQTNHNCSIDDPGPNPNVLTGAMVGGPAMDGSYIDDRKDYVHNEVATDYNAGFQGALAGLVHFAVNSLLPPAPTPKC